MLIYFFAGIQMSAAKVKQKKIGVVCQEGVRGRFAKSAVKQADWSAHVKGVGARGRQARRICRRGVDP